MEISMRATDLLRSIGVEVVKIDQDGSATVLPSTSNCKHINFEDYLTGGKCLDCGVEYEVPGDN